MADKSAIQITTLDVKPLGRSAAREFGTFSLKVKGSMPGEVVGHMFVVVWKRLEATGSSPPTSGMRESRVHSDHSANPVLR